MPECDVPTISVWICTSPLYYTSSHNRYSPMWRALFLFCQSLPRLWPFQPAWLCAQTTAWRAAVRSWSCSDSSDRSRDGMVLSFPEALVSLDHPVSFHGTQTCPY